MIEQIRNQIRESFKNLYFEEEEHVYTLKGNKLPAVSNCIDKYKKEFETDIIAAAYAKKHKRKVADVIKEWEDKKNVACDKGTKAHNFGERYFYDKTTKIENGYDKGIVKFWNDIPSTIVPLVCETRLYSETYKFAGTPDNLFWCTDREGIVITDYKGFPLDTPILTEKGWKTIGTISNSDKVFDKEGLLVNIKNVSEIHYNPCYKITFDNLESIIVDHEHKWLISFVTKGVAKDVVMTTEELSSYMAVNNRDSYKIPKIKNCKPLQIEKRKLPIDPYVLGVWLGDGHTADGKITNMNSEIWEQIKSRGYVIGDDVSQGSSGKASTRTVFGISTELKKLDLLGNKHLPEEYLLSSYNQRLELLRGFMDADGYYNPERKRFVASTTKLWQVDAIAMLVSSLGWKATILPCKKYCEGKVFQGYDVCFNSLGVNPFLVRNQKNVIFAKRTQQLYRTIKTIECVETVPTKCLEVDSESHTFLIGKSFIVTHNTNEDIYKNFRGKKMLSPFDFLLDMPLNHYAIQLSYYRIPLEDLGFNVVGMFLIWLDGKGSYQRIKVPDYSSHLRYYMSDIPNY